MLHKHIRDAFVDYVNIFCQRGLDENYQGQLSGNYAVMGVPLSKEVERFLLFRRVESEVNITNNGSSHTV